MVTTPPPMVLTRVKPRASVMVTMEPKVAAPPPTVLTMVTPAALVLVTRVRTVLAATLPPLDEAFVEPEVAANDAGEAPPAAGVEDECKVLATKTLVETATVVVLLPAGADVSVVAVAGPTGAGATLLDPVLVTALTGDATAGTAVVVEGEVIVEGGRC